jgi:hypothetical protein
MKEGPQFAAAMAEIHEAVTRDFPDEKLLDLCDQLCDLWNECNRAKQSNLPECSTIHNGSFEERYALMLQIIRTPATTPYGCDRKLAALQCLYSQGDLLGQFITSVTFDYSQLALHRRF